MGGVSQEEPIAVSSDGGSSFKMVDMVRLVKNYLRPKCSLAHARERRRSLVLEWKALESDVC